MQRLARISGHVMVAPGPVAASTLGVGAAGTGSACPRAGASKAPLNVLVTGAAGNIAFSIAFMIGQGAMLGPDQPIHLRLLDLPLPPVLKKLEAVRLELMDCAFPLIRSVTTTTEYEVAFRDAHVALLIGAKPRGKGMDRADLLRENAAIFVGQGKALNDFAARTCKVCVVGNPANTNALIAMANAPNIPRANFTALTRLDQNRAVSQIVERCGPASGVRVECVRNLIVWGNHSSTQFPDATHAVVLNHPHGSRAAAPLRAVVNDDAWLRSGFITTVQERGASIIAATEKSSVASAANAVVDHVRSWLLGTAPGEFVSMAVVSDANGYGVPPDLVFSFPVTCANGEWRIVEGLKMDAFATEKLNKTAAELLAERKTALGK